MSDHYMDHENNEFILIRTNVSCEVDRGEKVKPTGSHDRPAIFIEKSNKDPNDFLTLSYF